MGCKHLPRAKARGNLKADEHIRRNMNQVPAYINDKDAIVSAAWDGNYELVLVLIENGADINIRNEEGETALIAATDQGYQGIMELLLKKSADVNAKNNDGDTALDLARFHGYKSTIELLESHGATGTDGISARQKMEDMMYDDFSTVNAVKLLCQLTDETKAEKKKKKPDS